MNTYIIYAIIFLSGVLTGILLMGIKLRVKNTKLNSYKRELEKEAISSSENSSRVKVLESKIEVLEKALERAKKMGFEFNVGPECEFFLFQTNDNGEPIVV